MISSLSSIKPCIKRINLIFYSIIAFGAPYFKNRIQQYVAYDIIQKCAGAYVVKQNKYSDKIQEIMYEWSEI